MGVKAVMLQIAIAANIYKQSGVSPIGLWSAVEKHFQFPAGVNSK